MQVHVYLLTIYNLSSRRTSVDDPFYHKRASPPWSKGNHLALRGLTSTAADCHRNKTKKRREEKMSLRGVHNAFRQLCK